MLARQLARTTKMARHARQLARALPRLMEEFGTSRDPREVLDCADAVLLYYEKQGIVPPSRALVQRRTRECLGRGSAKAWSGYERWRLQAFKGSAMKYVLFVCTQNAGRSQMAQVLSERYAPEDICAESAGLEPAAQIHPTVIEAMKEIGIDISDRRPKKLTVEMQLHADLAVTLGCGGRCPYVPTHVEDWDLPDPAGRSLEEVRAIRDEIGGRVDDLLLHRGEEIRADRTAHELRLQKVIPGLVAEFEGKRTPQEIRECADAVLASFDDARIRSHVATLAERRTRDCLRADHCYELEVSR